MAGEPAPITDAVYCPRHLALYPSATPVTRILRRLAHAPGEVVFDQLLPDAPELARLKRWPPCDGGRPGPAPSPPRLELAKQGDVAVAQAGSFQPIHLARV